MRRSILLSLTVFVALIAGACSSGSSHSSTQPFTNSKGYQCATACGVSNPAPNPHPGPPVGPLPAVCNNPADCGPDATTTTLPKAAKKAIVGYTPYYTKPTTQVFVGFIPKAKMQQYCNKQYGFCVTFPVDLTPGGTNPNIGQPVATNGTTIALYDSTLLLDRRTGQFCSVSYPVSPRCKGFDSETYEFSVLSRPGWTEASALTRTHFDSDYDHVHSGSFLGNPAIFGTFRTQTGGYGPEIEVWHNGRLYDIAANGLTGAATYTLQFLASFRFTS